MTGASIADPSAGRIRFALYMRGACLFRLGRKEEAEESLRQGAQTAKNPGDRLECLQYLADILAASGKYEKPYRIAAKIFFFVGQYEDAVSVFERARENGVAFGPELRLYEIKTRRKRKPSKEEHRKLLKDCQALAEELEKEAEPDGQNPDFRDSRPEAQRELLGEVCCTLGLLYWDEKKADAAVRAMADAIRISPAHKEYRMFLGEFYIRKENYRAALLHLGEAAEAYGDDPAFHYSRGLCLQRLGRKNEAFEEFTQVLELDDAYRDANEYAADYYWEKYKDTYRESDLEKALFYMTRQLALDKSCYYYVERGRIYMQASRFAEAIEDFREAIALRPDDWAAYNNAGCCYKIARWLEEAEEMLKKAVACVGEGKNVLPYGNLADCYEIRGNYAMAAECCRRALEWQPDILSSYRSAARLLAWQGDCAGAVSFCRKAKKKLGDTYRQYWFDLGKIRFFCGNTLSALGCVIRGIAGRRKRPETWADAGEFFMEYMGRTGLAAWCWGRAAARRDGWRGSGQAWKEHAAAWLERQAECLFMRGKERRAREIAGKALALFREAGLGCEADYLGYQAFGPRRKGFLGRLYILTGEEERGLSLIRSMEEGYLCKDCACRGCYEKHLFLGRYYLAKGRYAEALKEFEAGLALHPREPEMRRTAERLRRRLKT